jgi:hypothetical protein
VVTKLLIGRFDKVHATLANAYSSMSTTSAFAFETLNQQKYTNNLSEILLRLDNTRRLLEQGKADLKTLLATFSKK